MSTNYYELKRPWADVRAEQGTSLSQVELWEEHDNEYNLTGMIYCGRIFVDADNLFEVLKCFFNMDDPICAEYAMRGGGTGLAPFRKPRRDTLISEYFEITSYKKLMKKYKEDAP